MTVPLVGEIRSFPALATAGTRGRWLACDGSAYPVGDYPALFSVIGYTFGQDGPDRFRVPLLCAAAPLFGCFCAESREKERGARLHFCICYEGEMPVRRARRGPEGASPVADCASAARPG